MKLQFKYHDKDIEFTVIKRKRKSICIKIEQNGEVVVAVPLRINKDDILYLVKGKAKWIILMQDEVKNRENERVIRQIKEKSTFMYLGSEYPVHLIFNNSLKKISVNLKECTNKTYSKCFEIHTNSRDEEKIKLALEKWYRVRTLEIVKKKIEFYACNFETKVSKIKVKEQKRRWATCTGENSILFNWRCSMAREDVIEYIVVHEMCHFDHRNHSKDFWNRVKEIMPDYKEKHEYLKINGMNMYI